jgi:hypothetical protein
MVPENQRTGQRTYPRRPILSKKKNQKLVTSSENFKKLGTGGYLKKSPQNFKL